ncbi:MAG TPA: cytochrome c [Burkholderiaceae bacterium]|jgi:mono/diheme cytochrome c family protein|nr:cytochrome c [Burkholderiaceae bacterium]
MAARNRWRWPLAAAIAAIAAAAVVAIFVGSDAESPADPADAALVSLGASVYARHCASCHGASLEGQPNWQTRRADGRLPAPPHDASGHTWHHPDRVLFEMVMDGVAKHAPPGYRSDMPAYRRVLSEREVWAVLAYIKSRWPPQILQRQQRIDRLSRER